LNSFNKHFIATGVVKIIRCHQSTVEEAGIFLGLSSGWTTGLILQMLIVLVRNCNGKLHATEDPLF
jgi:hypothetical protein